MIKCRKHPTVCQTTHLLRPCLSFMSPEAVHLLTSSSSSSHPSSCPHVLPAQHWKAEVGGVCLCRVLSGLMFISACMSVVTVSLSLTSYLRAWAADLSPLSPRCHFKCSKTLFQQVLYLHQLLLTIGIQFGHLISHNVHILVKHTSICTIYVNIRTYF